MITWAVCQTIIAGQLDNGVHLILAMACDVAMVVGSVALFCDAIRSRLNKKED